MECVHRPLDGRGQNVRRARDRGAEQSQLERRGSGRVVRWYVNRVLRRLSAKRGQQCTRSWHARSTTRVDASIDGRRQDLLESVVRVGSLRNGLELVRGRHQLGILPRSSVLRVQRKEWAGDR